MADTKIEWASAVWNPTVGCTRVSAGCDHCYAVRHTQRLAGSLPVYQGLVNPGKRHFNGTVRTLPDALERPLRWRKPRRIFVNSMSDLFHPDVPFGFIDRVFAVMALCPQHVFQILTKRPERMAAWMAVRPDFIDPGAILGRDDVPPAESWPLPNCWLGTSVEDQAAADERIPHLLQTPAAVRFLSCEPLLGPIRPPLAEQFAGGDPLSPRWRQIHWIIVGGESGPGARPCDVAWIRSLVDQCRAAGVAPFVKQLGAAPIDSAYTATFGPDGIHYTQPAGHPRELEHRAAIERGDAPGYSIGPMPLRLRDRKGGDPSEWPEDLRVREFPQTRAVA